MFLILLAAFLGFLIGGARGSLAGAAAGYVLYLGASHIIRNGLQKLQTQFVESTFAMVGAVSKADGVVTRDEIQFAEGLFVRLHLSPEQVLQAKAAFNRGKKPEFDIEEEVDRLLRVSRGSRALTPFFLRVLVIAVAADGRVHPAEHALLLRVAARLRLSPRQVAELEALLRMMAAGAAAGTGSRPDGPTPPQALEDAYAILGLSPEATDSEAKQAYRKLMKESHPDRIAAKGLPESMRDLAEGRAREINAAYDLIKKARGL